MSTAEVNGATLHYTERGSGSPLILLHGGLGAGSEWELIGARLAERFRVITPDSRGHGRSSNPAGFLSYSLLADDVAALSSRSSSAARRSLAEVTEGRSRWSLPSATLGRLGLSSSVARSLSSRAADYATGTATCLPISMEPSATRLTSPRPCTRTGPRS